MGRADRVRVAAAQISGIAAALAHVGRVGEDEALGEVAQILRAARVKPGSVRARELRPWTSNRPIRATSSGTRPRSTCS